MQLLSGVLALAGVVTMVTASAYDVDGGMYNDLLVQDLYKRLAQLQRGAQPDYYYDDENIQMPKNWMDSQEIPLEPRDSGSAQIRDQESVEHSSHADGFQYISGGAGEGNQHLTPEGSLQNQQEVKTDEHLPFYCHPPNPCPKGFTAEDGCDEFVDDSAEFQRKWIWKMQEKGMCACDEEHMFHCPKDDNTINTEKGNMEKNNLDQVLNSLLGDKNNNGIEDIDAALEEMKMAQQKKSDGNPFLGGYKLSRAAKKGLGYN